MPKTRGLTHIAPSFDPRRLRLVVFDVVGTTVRDGAAGSSHIARAFLDTFREDGLALADADVAACRGLDKREAVERLLRGHASGEGAGFEARVDRLTDSLLARIANGMHDAREIEGASDTFAFLQRRRIRVAVGSGLPQALTELLAVRLGWLERGLVDFVTSAEAAGAGRPDPAMIRSAMAHAGVADPRTVLKVGDTVVDIEEGRNAGAWTAAVLTGSQSRSLLQSAGPDLIVKSVAALPHVFDDPEPLDRER